MWILVISGIVIILFAGISSKKQMSRKGYGNVDPKQMPGGGLVVNKLTSVIMLLGWGLLIVGIIIFFV